MPEGNPFKPDAAGSTAPQGDSPFVAECGSCGRRIGVTAGMAGTQVPCQCGQTIAVPLLSELRSQTGRGAYGDDPLTVVKRLLAAKDSLPGDVCVACRRETTQKIVCLAECESPQAERQNPFRHLLALLSLPIWIVLEWLGKQRPTHGNEIIMRLPVTLRDECRSATKDLGRRRTLNRILRSVPAYARLLDEYPRTRVTLADEQPSP